jgi:hypothetical protein
MPAKDSEKTRQGEATTVARVVVKTQPVSHKDSDNRQYACGCRLWYVFLFLFRL